MGVIKPYWKKIIALCLIGVGLGILLVVLLPVAGWMFIIGVAITIIGVVWLLCG